MTLAGAAVLPSAPLLVPGVAATLPDGVAAVCDAVDAVVERLPADRVTLVAAAGDGWGVYSGADADLTAIGRPDVARRGHLDEQLFEALTGDLGWPVCHGRLGLDHAVLLLLLGKSSAGAAAVSVPRGAPFDELAAAGRRLAEVLAAVPDDVVLLVSGDLAAGLDERSPLHVVDGAREFDSRLVDAVDAGRLDALARLGPETAARVGARGWAPLALLHGVLERAKLGVVRRTYAAPRGVGYLVAYGA